tara:strand:+ start:2772 stop:3368 length:597 start_codon:yes stop_codon:yes gene_type:complete
MKKTILLLSIFLSTLIFSQKDNGKIFLKNGEVKTGFIRLGLFSTFGLASENIVVFKKNKESNEKIKYTLNDINKVVLEKKGTYFMKKNEKGEILITNLIYEGSPLSLYLYWEEGFNGQRSPSYYFQKGNENLKLIYRGLGNSSDKKMRKYFSDCPKLAEYIKSRTFETYVERSPKFKDKNKLNSKLIEIVKYYNENCH